MQNAERFWEGEPAWRDGRVRSSTKRKAVALLTGSLAWIALTVALVWLVLPGELQEGSPWVWPLLLFPLIGVLLSWAAVRGVVEWHRYRDIELVLDPFPGSLGGHVGGSVDIPLQGLSHADCGVTLACVRVSQSSRGHRRAESVVWEARITPRTESAGQGTRLRFTFEVPAHLPPSEPAAEDHHQWVIRVRGEADAVKLDRSFVIPVAELAMPLQADDVAVATSPDIGRLLADFPDHAVRVHSDIDGLVLHYPARRNVKAAIILLVSGLLFAGTSVYFGMWALGVEELVQPLIVGASAFAAVCLAILGLLGLGVFGVGVFLSANTLQVLVGSERIESRRRFLGLVLRRSGRVADLRRIYMTRDGEDGHRVSAQVSYNIRAYFADGRRLLLGDGIRGREVAHGLARLIERETGTEVHRSARRRRTDPGAEPGPVTGEHKKRPGSTGPNQGVVEDQQRSPSSC